MNATPILFRGSAFCVRPVVPTHRRVTRGLGRGRSYRLYSTDRSPWGPSVPQDIVHRPDSTFSTDPVDANLRALDILRTLWPSSRPRLGGLPGQDPSSEFSGARIAPLGP